MDLLKIYCALLLTLCCSSNALKIYDNLIQCYRSNSTEPLVPSTMQVLIELLRKVENHSANSFDIRTLSVSLIHKLRIDGIQKAIGIQETEFVTPYDATSLMRPKMEILLSLISEVPGMVNFDEILTPVELCTLHKLISSSVDSFKRGDEHRTCSNDHQMDQFAQQDKIFISDGAQLPYYVVPHYISKCPLEMGTVKAFDYGTLSPGTVIASIAAGLEPQLVFLKELVKALPEDPYTNLESMDRRDVKSRNLLQSLDTVDNTFAANLAGDLAEVCVYQAPYERANVTVGSFGYWNDTEYPIVRYLRNNHPLHWAMTDAEILGGIDGLHLSTTIRSLVSRLHRIRLSQILEMYYSPSGIPSFTFDTAGYMDPKFTQNEFQNELDSVCEREKTLNRMRTLKDQTFYTARILQHYTRSVSVDQDLLRKSCNAAVEQFYSYAHKLVARSTRCGNKNKVRQPVDLTVVLNGPRNRFENLKLLSHLSEIIDVSIYGSTISVVHGSTGEYLVSSENSIVSTFDNLKNYNDNLQNKLSLTESLSAIVHNLNSKIVTQKKTAGNSEVVLILGQQQPLTDDEFENAKRLIDSSFQAFPDLHFIFLTDNVKAYRDLISDAIQLTDSEVERYTIIESSNLDPMAFSTALHNALSKIPRYLHIPRCGSQHNRQPGDAFAEANMFEDYVSRGKGNFFRINVRELRESSDFWVKFRGVDYGAISVCMTRDSKEYECQSTLNADSELVWFNVTSGCDKQSDGGCPPVTFKVELDSTKVKCTENDCRYPDQVRYFIDIGSAKCAPGSSPTLLFNLYLLFMSIFIVKFLI